MVWRGAYVFELTLNEGFVLKGTVTHIEKRDVTDVYGNIHSDTDNLYLNMDYWVNRGLYIGNTLYTISNGRVQLNSLNDLSLIAQVELR